ncbi:DUF3313 domain-containing protein [Desulfatiferula olefinivorans]
MNTSYRMGILIVIAVTATLFSCASSTPKQPGFLKGYYQYLEHGPEGGAKLRWQKPGTDFSKYDKIMLDNIVYFFAEDSEYKGIEAEQLVELSNTFKQEIIDAYKDTYPVVTEPGPGVARLKIAITGLKQSKPVISGISTIVPIGLGVSMIKKGSTGAWTGSGRTSVELIVIDSMTEDVISVAQDEQIAGFTERFSKLGSAKEAFKYWAKRLRAFTDRAHGKI